MEKLENKNIIKNDINLVRIQMIDEILDNNHNVEDNKKLANYDAIFEEGKEPFLINIWRIKKGYELGYIAFHDFLIRVGQNNTFSSTDLEEAGKKMFKKAVDQGLLKQVSEKSGLGNITRWEVINDPIESLKILRSRPD